ncbi:MAG: PIN domain-containing protein [Deltaproteobacteria bacterium]
MRFIDANIILRYLLEDDPGLSKRAAIILEHQDVHVPFEVLSEVVYVMQGVYKASRQNISEVLSRFLMLPNISTTNTPVAIEALKLYEAKGLDFVDALLCGYARIDSVIVETFDKKLIKCCSEK